MVPHSLSQGLKKNRTVEKAGRTAAAYSEQQAEKSLLAPLYVIEITRRSDDNRVTTLRGFQLLGHSGLHMLWRDKKEPPGRAPAANATGGTLRLT